MNSINLQVHPITKQESLFARKFGLRVFAELDNKGREIAFFGEVHASTTALLPGKPIITRAKGREPIRVDRLLRSVPKKHRRSIREDTNLGRMAAYCHAHLKNGPVSRGALQDGIEKEYGYTHQQFSPALSDLLDADGYNHLRTAD